MNEPASSATPSPARAAVQPARTRRPRFAHRAGDEYAVGGAQLDVRCNRLLAALPDESRERLTAHGDRLRLVVREPIHDAGERIRHVYFPLTGVVSLVSPPSAGPAVELATVGSEGVVGIAAFLADGVMPHRAFVQVPGWALRVPSQMLADEADRDRALSDVLKRYTQLLLAQVAQSAACNRLHSVEARCARWLLLTHDRVGGAERFPLTQEFLAQMLGVRRATVTVAAGTLQRAALIDYSRGKITVVDRLGLERASCECYRIVRAELERLFGSAPQPPERSAGAAA